MFALFNVALLAVMRSVSLVLSPLNFRIQKTRAAAIVYKDKPYAMKVESQMEREHF